MKNTIELMKPRYKVIADYPGSEEVVGSIIHFMSLKQTEDQKYHDRFPHIYRKLFWWEERKPEEMPEYVKRITTPLFKSQPKFGEVLHVAHWQDNGEDGNYAQFIEYYGQYWKASNFEPATEKEYNTYKNNL